MSEFRAALALCSRPKGATSRDLADAMHCADCDAPYRLRLYVQQWLPEQTLFSVRMPPERRAREGYTGPARTYHLKAKGQP